MAGNSPRVEILLSFGHDFPKLPRAISAVCGNTASLGSSQGVKYCVPAVFHMGRVSPYFQCLPYPTLCSPSPIIVRILSPTHSAGYCHSLHIGEVLQLLRDKVPFFCCRPALPWLSDAVT